nr:MAG TPA: hypothetical protein [Caudoviricetes sp.]
MHHLCLLVLQILALIVLPHVKTNLQEYGFLNEWED